jgi:hypothetical protein
VRAEPGHPAGDQAGDDRRAQADEADRPGHGHRDRRQQHRDADREHPGPADVDPEHPGRVVAEAEHVEPVREQERGEHADRDDRRGHRDVLASGLDGGAAPPREQSDGVLLEQHQEYGGERVQRQRHGRAGQHEPGRPGRPAARDEQDDARGEQPARDADREAHEQRGEEPGQAAGHEHGHRLRARVVRLGAGQDRAQQLADAQRGGALGQVHRGENRQQHDRRGEDPDDSVRPGALDGRGGLRWRRGGRAGHRRIRRSAWR